MSTIFTGRLFLRHKKAHAILNYCVGFLFFTLCSLPLMVKKSGIPKGIRTPVTAVKGRCPRPLDDRDTELTIINGKQRLMQTIYQITPVI